MWSGGVRPHSLAFGAYQIDNKTNLNNGRALESFFWWVLCCLCDCSSNHLIGELFIFKIMLDGRWVLDFLQCLCVDYIYKHEKVFNEL
ncbi:hypothetical protein Hanom_Chr10g00925681 [Helianthus anomalus]